MAAGLVGAYGTFGYMLGEFVYPAAGKSKGWLFVCTVDVLAEEEALDFTSPTGAKVVVARQGAGTGAEDFLALSSVCPHLGCRVHWESQNDRFFCPCHNGAFDRGGKHVAIPASSQACVICHQQSSPGITDHWTDSTHAVKGVGCVECHQAEKHDADAFDHYGAMIAVVVTPRD